jgi:hypothetical protein
VTGSASARIGIAKKLLPDASSERGCPFQSAHNRRVTHVIVVGDCAQAQSLNMDHAGHLPVLMRRELDAQRSGRAGRSGQAALVVAYCAAQSPHDQYFFRQPKAMELPRASA